MGEGKPREPSLWGAVWFGGIALAGLVLAIYCLLRLPPARASLAAAEAVAPIHVTDELVHETRRRGASTWRRQNVAVAGAGRGHLVVSPPRTLWVPDIDRLDRGTKVRFLIDPDARLIYEARLGERVLLSYETSAGSRRGAALGGLGFAGLMLAVGGFGLWRERRLFGG